MPCCARPARLGIVVRPSARVASVTGAGHAFTVGLTDGGTLQSRAVVLATGGRSLPKTGSDGTGYDLAQSLGHTIVSTIPGLAPLVLEGGRHAALAGRSHPATLSLRVHGRTTMSLTGPLLWTHFGISGPVALNMSRHWHRATRAVATTDAHATAKGVAASDASATADAAAADAAVTVALSVCPGDTRQSLETWLQEQSRARPRAQVATVLATRLPADVADAWTVEAGIAAETTLAHLSRPERRALVDALVDTPLHVRDSRGYNYAEVTAGGVPLEEIDHRTMGSRTCPGLYLVGEILDVDGRLGGFNFQWAWSSGWVAGQAIAGRVVKEGLS